MSKSPPKPQPKPRNVKIMRAIYDYTAEEEDELSFQVGDILYILDQGEDDWFLKQPLDLHRAQGEIVKRRHKAVDFLVK